MNDELTPAESLKLIESMISDAKRSFHRNSFYFLLWGILLIAAMIFNMVMIRLNYEHGDYAWPVIGIGGGLASFIYGARESKRQRVHTAMDRVIMWLWVGFIVTMLATMIGAGTAGYTTPIGSIMVLTGLPTFVSGQLMKFRPLIFGGILFWVLGAVSYFVSDLQVMAALYVAAMLFGYIVPGYLLKRQEDAVRAA